MSTKSKKKHIITIAGRPGSGKSTTAKTVAAKLGFDHFSSGDLFREIGRQRGIDVVQTNLSAEENTDIDELVDGRLREIGQTEDKKVIDSRTAWHWIPNSFKVYLDLDLETAARRILNELTEGRAGTEKIAVRPDEYAALLRHRLELEMRRYKAKYGIDPYDIKNYDLVIDTSSHDLDEVGTMILTEFRRWVKT